KASRNTRCPSGAWLSEPEDIDCRRRGGFVNTLDGQQGCCRSQARAPLECAGIAQRRRRFGSAPNGDGSTPLRDATESKAAWRFASRRTPKNAGRDDFAERGTVSHKHAARLWLRARHGETPAGHRRHSPALRESAGLKKMRKCYSSQMHAYSTRL